MKRSTKLIFLHIPKAGGTTLHSMIERQYKKGKIYNIDGGDVQKSTADFKKKRSSIKKGMTI